jgi:hypothetical protein
MALVPWLLPAAIGVPATVILKGYYQKRFVNRGVSITPVDPGAAVTTEAVTTEAAVR